MSDAGSRDLTLEDLVTLNRFATVARLLSGAAHEVNNALQVIGGTVELLEDRPELPEPVTRGLTRIRTQHGRAAAAIAEVLAFAREKPDVRGRTNLRDAAARAVALRSFSVERAGLKIAFHAPEGEPFIVEGSRAELQQAILNLITNAEQALAGAGGGRITVEMQRGDAHWITIRVSDTGPGVPAELRARIFEPFFTTRPRHEASGLGLPTARGVAERHGGTLTLVDTASGAAFELRLPAAG